MKAPTGFERVVSLFGNGHIRDDEIADSIHQEVAKGLHLFIDGAAALLCAALDGEGEIG